MSDDFDMPDDFLERHLHAGRAPQGRPGRITLLILVLAMLAAVAGKISAETEVRYLTAEIELSDTWAQYQGKSDRQAIAQGLANLAGVLPNAGEENVQALIAQFNAAAARLDSDEKGDGKQQLAARAKDLTAARDHYARRMEGFSFAVVLLAICIGLGSASMLSRARWTANILAAIACLVGLCAACYGVAVGLDYI